MLPGTKGKYIRIPTPYGYALFWNIGDEIGRAVNSAVSGIDYSPVKGGARIAASFGETFNPLASGSFLQMVMPTIGDPVAMAYENKTWFGGPLMPGQNQFDNKPDSQRYWRSVSPVNKAIADKVNSWTGGSKVRSGAIDISPETLDMIVETYTGSLGRFIKDTLNMPVRIYKGDIEARNVPFVRKFSGVVPEWADSKIYRSKVDDIKTLSKEYEMGTPTQRREIRRKKEFRYIPIMQRTEKLLRRLKKERRKLALLGRDTTSLDKKIRNIEKKFLKTVK
jgi:hypothetical protein